MNGICKWRSDLFEYFCEVFDEEVFHSILSTYCLFDSVARHPANHTGEDSSHLETSSLMVTLFTIYLSSSGTFCFKGTCQVAGSLG